MFFTLTNELMDIFFNTNKAEYPTYVTVSFRVIKDDDIYKYCCYSEINVSVYY